MPSLGKLQALEGIKVSWKCLRECLGERKLVVTRKFVPKCASSILFYSFIEHPSACLDEVGPMEKKTKEVLKILH